MLQVLHFRSDDAARAFVAHASAPEQTEALASALQVDGASLSLSHSLLVALALALN
jgi:hypothetical protein